VGIITRVAQSLQTLFGTMAEEVAEGFPVVLRQRKFTTATLAKTFLFGFLAHPRATDEELAQTAGLFGVHVTTQAVEQRFTPQLAAFLEALFRKATCHVVHAQKTLAPILERFPAVYLLDSTSEALPDAQRDRFPGCGGSHGGGQAALKLQTLWEIRNGALQAVQTEAGRDCDYKTPLQAAPLAPGSLRIADLGYFDTAVLQDLDRAGVYFLSRLQFGTAVFTPPGQPLRLLDWLAQQGGSFVDQHVLVGAERRVPCRIIAWRLPEEQANRRRQKLITEARRKDGRTPSQERLAWCDWTILVTNVPPEGLTPREAAILYRARWQIELLFKRWKSLGLIAELAGSTVARQMVRIWSRLLTVIVQHWVMLSTVWGDARSSFTKVWKAIQDRANLLARALDDPARLEYELEQLRDTLKTTAKQNKRKKASTFELLNDPAKLDYSLT
jgi:Transposase DDE domain